MSVDLEGSPGIDDGQERRPFGGQPSELELVRPDTLIELAVGAPERLPDQSFEVQPFKLHTCHSPRTNVLYRSGTSTLAKVSRDGPSTSSACQAAVKRAP
jgi:hypothetical protein